MKPHMFFRVLCAAWLIALLPAAGSGADAFEAPVKVPPAVVQKQPNPGANGQRPWEGIAETEVEKIRAALPEKAEATPKQPRKLLVFYRADGYPHSSIPHWNKLIDLLGKTTGAFEVTLSQDYADLMPGKIEQYDALFFNNTCRMVTPPEVKTAIQAFVKGGKGFVGNHGAGDNWHDWAEGLEMVGAEFARHPFGNIVLKVDDPASPLTAMFGGKPFAFSDEIYTFRSPYARDKLRVLLSIDYEKSPDVQKGEQRAREKGGQDAGSMRADHDYALAWVRPWQKGRVFYCALGHKAEVTFDPRLVRFFLAGIQYALGDLAADDAPMGGTPPSAEPPKQHEIFADLTFAEGFDVKPFAAPPMIVAPVFVSANADGVLYVSGDPNGSVGNERGKGRILRLVDKDDDGRADTVTDFVTKIDSPRGIVAEGDTVYVLHPPHISRFTDTNGDGAADQSQVIAKNIGWDLSARKADHGSNGLSLGIDGWIYAAIGDFGFTKAEGTDGRTAQLRGGGVIRVRRDGTGLEVYARGTRNILEVEMSPLLDGFARDNTNDGGGWNVRFHHITGLEDHGYPSLFRNFADEVVAPIVDYGGGSGCGGVWMGEPGWPGQWSNQPIEADWGRQIVYGHALSPKGATFEEKKPPAEFCALKKEVTRGNAFRPTDLDVDAQGRMFLVSWRDGGFNAGSTTGFIFRITPYAQVPWLFPDRSKVKPVDLAKLIAIRSHRARQEAQRLLVSRCLDAEARTVLGDIARGKSITPGNEKDLPPLECRVAAIFTLAQTDGEQAWPLLVELAADPAVAAWAVRALADDERIAAKAPIDPIKAGLASPDARVRREAAVAVARIGKPEVAPLVAPLLGDADPLVAHTARQALVRLRAIEPCLAVFDDSAAPPNRVAMAVQAIDRLYEKPAVDGLIERLAQTADSTRRRPLLAALCRLYQREGEWQGDGWGTVPDTRGPYYQPETWSESPRIAEAIVSAIDTGGADEAVWLGAELAKNRVSIPAAMNRLIALAESEPKVVPPLVKQLSQADELPEAAVPLLIRVTADKALDHDTRNFAITALCKVDSAAAVTAVLQGFTISAGGNEYWRGRNAFRGYPFLTKHHQLLIDAAARDDGTSRIAEEGLLKIAANVLAPQAVRDDVVRAIQTAWNQGPKRQRQIVDVARETRYAEPALARLIAPLVQSDDEALAKAAQEYFKSLNLDPEKVLTAKDEPPAKLVGAMPVDEAIAAVVALKGDRGRGDQLFNQLACVACHTTKADLPPKGPYLGNTAAIYKRAELAAAVLEPSKTIAQGFTTNVILLDDGRVLTGFVTREAADTVSLRLADATEVTIRKDSIDERNKLEGVSVMPAGLVANITPEDFASLLTYVQSLVPASAHGHGQ
jgi:putative membrane-bound dehydrogenase-like protein